MADWLAALPSDAREQIWTRLTPENVAELSELDTDLQEEYAAAWPIGYKQRTSLKDLDEFYKTLQTFGNFARDRGMDLRTVTLRKTEPTETEHTNTPGFRFALQHNDKPGRTNRMLVDVPWADENGQLLYRYPTVRFSYLVNYGTEAKRNEIYGKLWNKRNISKDDLTDNGKFELRVLSNEDAKYDGDVWIAVKRVGGPEWYRKRATWVTLTEAALHETKGKVEAAAQLLAGI